MNYRPLLLLVISLCNALPTPAPAQTDAGIQLVHELAQLNGQALACQDLQTARGIKNLMLAHAPKTARFATVFDDETKQSFLAQTRGNIGCPESSLLLARLEELSKRLHASLPSSSATQQP